MSRRATGFVLASWSLLALSAHAEEPAETVDPSYQTVVTGSRAERRVKDAPVTTEVIDRKEIRQSNVTDLSRLLENQSGVQVDRTFRGAGLRLQGLDPEQTLLLVDGERVAGQIGGTLDLGRFRLEDIERVEIVKGAASALYGTDAMGGVVNLIPRRCSTTEYDARVLGTSLWQTDVSGSAAVPFENVCFRLTGSFRRSPSVAFGVQGPATVVDGQLSGNGGGRVEWEPTKRLRVMLSANLGRNDYTGVSESATTAIFDQHTRVSSADVTLRPELTVGDSGKLRLSLRQSFFQHELLQDQRLSNELDSYQKTVAQIWNATLQHEQKLGASHQLVAGGEGYWERLESPRLNTGHGSRGRGALFAQDEWRVTEKRPLTIVPGLRFDADTQFGSRFSPRLAARWDALDSFSIHASYGFGFRAASFQELLIRFENTGVGYRVDGNPNLKPERSRGAQFGAEWRPHDRVAVTLESYYNDVDDLISTNTLPRTGPGPTLYSYTNVARAEIRGGELGLRLRPMTRLRVDLAYALTDARDLTLSRQLPGRAMHRATAKATYEYKPWGLETGVRASWVSARPFYEDTNSDGTDERRMAAPYSTIDVRVSKTLTDLFTVIVGADNLLNAGDPTDLPILPRNVYAGLSLRR